ncbi:acyl-CoA synthetase (AMP-forming)/AMP-acid ligase II [Mycolicibacterium moriokaense]|uniref:Acyl-CoA synthetase (AMP-forming)/AMP-acid ligase II n=2 Tax=Mycolicibacterium moriokaense TaxID=39691 RepID=A0A318HDA5_9MYCO|nr:acyl-CoA synthetase (AMP-forming)/AMP-acid ligase II [Mycolicibacterium moriokaense]
MSFAELDRNSADIARGLLARGIGKGTRVGLLLGNGPYWVAWWAALGRIGAMCIPLSTFLQPAELVRAVRHSDIHLLVAQRRFLNRDFASLIADAFPDAGADPLLALSEAPYLRTIVMDDTALPWMRGSGWVTDAGRASHWETVLECAQREVHPDDEALCIYTSGQSADPKGVLFTQAMVVIKAEYLRGMFGFTTSSVTAATMPFFWVGGLVMALFPTMAAGGTTRCTDRSTWGLGGVIGHGGGTSRDASDSAVGLSLMPSLGMTETLGMYSWGREWAVEPYPIAAPIDALQPGFEIRLVDEAGDDVGEGTAGEIVVRGPTVAARLHKVARRDAFDPDGFYRTGDRAIRHGDRVSFLGRIADTIKTSGANVSPAEVERELAGLDGVAVAHVVGIDDPDRDQLVAAAVLRTPGSILTEEEIRVQLRQRLSVYKVPRVIVFLNSMDEVPMTPSMKVRKRALAEFIDSRRNSDGER